MKCLTAWMIVLAVNTAAWADETPAVAGAATTRPSEAMVTRIYDVADLIVPISGTPSEEGGDRAVRKYPFDGQMLSPEQAMKELREAIMGQVSPASWTGKPGGRGLIQAVPTGTQFVVRQTPDIQEQVAAYLHGARADRAIQVSVETLFLTAKAEGLREVGLDVDQTFTSAKSAATRPLQVDGTYLEERGYRLIIDHLDQIGGRVLASSTLQVINGGQAEIRMVKGRAYVANVEPTTRPTGEVLYHTKKAVAEDGDAMWVRASVSADRTYVTLYLIPSLSKVLELAPFTFRPAQSPSKQAKSYDLTIQEPRTQNMNVTTLVSVPDGKWLLLGGQTISEPGHEKDREVLLVFVRPRILTP